MLASTNLINKRSTIMSDHKSSARSLDYSMSQSSGSPTSESGLPLHKYPSLPPWLKVRGSYGMLMLSLRSGLYRNSSSLLGSSVSPRLARFRGVVSVLSLRPRLPSLTATFPLAFRLSVLRLLLTYWRKISMVAQSSSNLARYGSLPFA